MSPELCIRQIEYGSAEWEAEVQLRLTVLRQPLGLTFPLEELALETDTLHIGAFAADTLIGCLLLTPQTQTICKMRQVAVAAKYRGRGIGRALVQHAEVAAKQNGYTEIVLHARETAVAFYLALKYLPEGEPFTEVTLPHLAMRRKLSQKADILGSPNQF